jgi:hypothetical protein
MTINEFFDNDEIFVYNALTVRETATLSSGSKNGRGFTLEAV